MYSKVKVLNFSTTKRVMIQLGMVLRVCFNRLSEDGDGLSLKRYFFIIILHKV
jgi:hypothetical protein